LPAPVSIFEERTVGASLGPELVRSGSTAAIIGLVLVIAFMIAYYRRQGVIASAALLLNGLLILAALSSVGATLTLPGIAGFVLTLGMAVDANVLISERIREELRAGRAGKAAIRERYRRAFNAIFDSNVTTLIAAFVLLQYGTGPVRGFAVTLSIGIIASFFTAVYVTRVINALLLERGAQTDSVCGRRGENCMEIIKPGTTIDFLGKRRTFVTASFALVLLILVLIPLRVNLGVDFAGGTEIEVKFHRAVEVEKLRGQVAEAGFGGASVQQIGSADENAFLIRVGQVSVLSDEDLERYREAFARELSSYGFVGLSFNP